MIHRMDHYTDQKAQLKEQEEKEEDKRQEKEDEDFSFATSSLLTCFEDAENELNEAILSLNEDEIKTSKEEHTVDTLASKQDPNFDQDNSTLSVLL